MMLRDYIQLSILVLLLYVFMTGSFHVGFTLGEEEIINQAVLRGYMVKLAIDDHVWVCDFIPESFETDKLLLP